MYEWVCTRCDELVTRLGGSRKRYTVGRIAPGLCAVCQMIAAPAALNAVPDSVMRAYRQAEGFRSFVRPAS